MILYTEKLNCAQFRQLNRKQMPILLIEYHFLNDSFLCVTPSKIFIGHFNRRILTDRLQAGIKTSKVQELYNFGIKIHVNSKYKIEHNKFAVFDLKNVITGSYNWTETASNKNSENCLFFN